MMSTLTTRTKATTITESVSLVLMKNLMRTTISSVAYLRGFFPDRVFTDRHLEGMKLKLMKKGVNEQADLLMNWLEQGCFDALARRYLRTMVLAVCSDEHASCPVETYTYKFIYGSAGETTSVLTRNNEILSETSSLSQEKGRLKRQTQSMLRNLVISAQSLSELPEQCYVTMHLGYYDNITPPEYEPPMFTMNYAELGGFEDNYMQLRVASIATPHHGMKLRIKSTSKEYTAEHADQTDAVPELTETLVAPPVSAAEPGDAQFVVPQGNTPNNGVEEMVVEESQRDDRFITNQVVTPHLRGPGIMHIPVVVRCPCERSEMKTTILVVCTRCKYSQHAVCFGLEDMTSDHVCDQCVTSDDACEATRVSHLYNQVCDIDTKYERAARTILLKLLRTSKAAKITDVAIHNTTGLPKDVVQSGMKHLHMDGFVRSRTRKGYPIVRRRVKGVSHLYYLQPVEVGPARGDTVGSVPSPILEGSQTVEQQDDMIVSVDKVDVVEKCPDKTDRDPETVRYPRIVKKEVATGKAQTWLGDTQCTVPDSRAVSEASAVDPADDVETVPDTMSRKKSARKVQSATDTVRKVQSKTVSEFIDVDEMTSLTREMAMNVSQRPTSRTDPGNNPTIKPGSKTHREGERLVKLDKTKSASPEVSKQRRISAHTQIQAPVPPHASRKRGRALLREVIDDTLRDVTNTDSQDSWMSQTFEREPKRTKTSITAAHFTTVRH